MRKYKYSRYSDQRFKELACSFCYQARHNLCTGICRRRIDGKLVTLGPCKCLKCHKEILN